MLGRGDGTREDLLQRIRALGSRGRDIVRAAGRVAHGVGLVTALGVAASVALGSVLVIGTTVRVGTS